MSDELESTKRRLLEQILAQLQREGLGAEEDITGIRRLLENIILHRRPGGSPDPGDVANRRLLEEFNKRLEASVHGRDAESGTSAAGKPGEPADASAAAAAEALLRDLRDASRAGAGDEAFELVGETQDLASGVRGAHDLMHDILAVGSGSTRNIEAEGAEAVVAQMPARIGDFEIVRRLGGGGMGEVYLARQVSLGRLVALKVVCGGAFSDPRALKRFLREARAAARIEHPSIISIFEAGVVEGRPYIAMRYIDGETLATKIATARTRLTDTTGPVQTRPSSSATEAPRPAGAVAPIAPELPGRTEILRILHLVEGAARALDVAHEQGLIHRDVKPSNIMVTRDGEPVLLDFGLAHMEEEEGAPRLTAPGDLMGTLPYMSPEQLLASRVPLDRRTDVYSLGVTLYECLTLQLPFQGGDEAIRQAILAKPLPNPRRINRSISRDLRVVLEKATEKDPERRYHSARDLAEDLRRIREGEPIRARAASPVLRARRWAWRHPTLTVAAAALLLTLGLGWYTLQSGLRAREYTLFRDVFPATWQRSPAEPLRFSFSQDPAVPVPPQDDGFRTPNKKAIPPGLALVHAQIGLPDGRTQQLAVEEGATVDWTPLVTSLRGLVERWSKSGQQHNRARFRFEAEEAGIFGRWIREDLSFEWDTVAPRLESVTVSSSSAAPPKEASTGQGAGGEAKDPRVLPIQKDSTYLLPGSFVVEVRGSDEQTGIVKLEVVQLVPTRSVLKESPWQGDSCRMRVDAPSTPEQLEICIEDRAGNRTSHPAKLYTRFWAGTTWKVKPDCLGNELQMEVRHPRGFEFRDEAFDVHVHDGECEQPHEQLPKAVGVLFALTDSRLGTEPQVLTIPLGGSGDPDEHARPKVVDVSGKEWNLETGAEETVSLVTECVKAERKLPFVRSLEIHLEPGSRVLSVEDLWERGVAVRGESDSIILCDVTMNVRPTEVSVKRRADLPMVLLGAEGGKEEPRDTVTTVPRFPESPSDPWSRSFRFETPRGQEVDLRLRLRVEPDVPGRLDFQVVRDGESDTLGSQRDWAYVKMGAKDLVRLRGTWPADLERIVARTRDGAGNRQDTWGDCARDRKEGNIPWEIPIHSDMIRRALGGTGDGEKPVGRLAFEMELVDVFQNRKCYAYTLLVNWVPQETILHRGIEWHHAVDNVYLSDEVSVEMLEEAARSTNLSTEAAFALSSWIDALRSDRASPDGATLPVVGLSCEEALSITRLLRWRLPTLAEWRGTVDHAIAHLEARRDRTTLDELHQDILREENLRAERYGPHDAVRKAREVAGQSLFVPVTYPDPPFGPAGDRSRADDSVEGSASTGDTGEEGTAIGGLRQLLGNVREYAVEYTDRSPIAPFESPNAPFYIARGWIVGADYDTLLLHEPPEGKEESPMAGTLWFLDREGRVAFEGLKSRVEAAPARPPEGTERPLAFQWTGFRFAIAAGEGTDLEFDRKFRELARSSAQEGGETK